MVKIAKLSKNNGFTLVEVLIAAVILFMALAITADLFKSSSFTANKVTTKALALQTTYSVIETIKAEINIQTKQQKLAEFSGQVVINSINYQWQAERTSFKSRPLGFDETIEPSPQFGLYTVNVYTQNTGEFTEHFSFQVATW